jgi:hypothetical protein
LVLTGNYHLVLSQDIQDTFGNKMDQNGNLIPGEPGVPPAGDQYAADFGIAGLRITAPTSTINSSGPTFSVRVTFNEAMDVSTFTPSKIASFTGPNGPVPVLAVIPVGTNPLTTTQFDIMFAPQQVTGVYTMVIGPDIRDLFGNKMDQDNNLVPGEVPQDQFTLRFTVPGPRITSSSSLGNQVAGFNHLVVTFNEPMQRGMFTPGKIASFTDPMGNPVTVTGVMVVPFTNEMQFDIRFNPAGRVGTYTMVIGPDILDLYGNQMDQNQNLIPGEPGVDPAGDQFRLTFNITGPVVVSVSPAGSHQPPVDHVRVTYNEPMNPDTFTTDLVSLTGPDGSPIDVTGVQPVAGSNNTQFDVSFDAQTTLGAYAMVIAAGVMDPFGNSAPEFTFGFLVANDAVQNGGFETGDFSGWTTGGGRPTPVISTAQAHSGTYSAFLGTLNTGSEPFGDSFIEQTITVPDGHPTLSFWYFPNTTDSVTYDWQEAQIRSTSGAVLAQIFRVASNSQTWTQVTFDLTPFAGQTVVLYFNVHQDGAGDPTGMYLDDVSVVSTGGGGGAGGRSARSGGIAGGNDRLPQTAGDQNLPLGTTKAGGESGLTTPATVTDVARALVMAYANLLTPVTSTSRDAEPNPAGLIPPAPFGGSNTDLFPAPGDAKAPGKQQLAVALALAGDWYDPLADLGGLDGLAQLKHLNGKR